MSLQNNDKDAERRRKPDSRDAAPEAGGSSRQQQQRRRLPSSDVGSALKSAYDRTLHENIPPEMLDLLGKLG